MNNVTDILPNQNIVVVVPYAIGKSEPLPYIDTFKEIAEQFSCKLVFFSAIYDRAAEIDTWVSGTYLENFRKPLVSHHKHWLEKEAESLRNSGLTVEVVVEWAKNPMEVLEPYLADHPVSLLVSLAEHHNVISRTLHRPLEWQLIRLPSVPVLLLQSPVTLKGGLSLVALDVAQSNQSQDGTNQELLAAAQSWCQAMDSKMNLVNAYPSAADFLAYAPAGWQMPELQGDLARQHQSRLEAYLTQLGIAGEAHVGEGHPGEVIHQLAGEMKASLVVVGCQCREGMSGWLIGNEAEPLLEKSYVNMLVVKF